MAVSGIFRSATQGFAVSCFAVNWETQTVTCPQGKTSQTGHPRREKYGHNSLEFRFALADGHACAYRLDCTQSKRGVRVVSLRPQAEYETLKAAWERQETPEIQNQVLETGGDWGHYFPGQV